MKIRRAGIFTKIVIAALIIYASVKLVSLTTEVADAKAYQDSLQQQVTELTEANAELQYEIDHAADPETIEDIAREKLGLVMPGEKIFYDVSN